MGKTLVVFDWIIKSRIILGFLYVVCIFAFAHKYTGMERAFLESNIKYELPYAQKTSDVTNNIANALQKAASAQVIGKVNSKFAIDDQTYLSDMSLISWNDVVEADTSAINFHTWVSANVNQRKADGTTSTQQVDFPIDIRFIQHRFFGEKEFKGRLFYDPDDPEFNMKPVVDADLTMGAPVSRNSLSFSSEQQAKAKSLVLGTAIFGRIQKVADNTYTMSIAMPRTVSEEMDQFLRAASGFTSDLGDNWSRMLYFSATTITTLGFGDIVPITPDARWWVTAEAFAGVVLIGLFLNSLAR